MFRAINGELEMKRPIHLPVGPASVVWRKTRTPDPSG